MKTLSDFKGEAAIDLGEQILDFGVEVITDTKVAEAFQKSKVEFVQAIVKNHKKELTKLLVALDPDEELNGLNMIERLAAVINELSDSEVIGTFFGWQSQTEIKESSGSATANTKAKGR